MRVQRSREADGNDQEEENERCQRDPVPDQSSPGEAPGALSRDLLDALAGRKAYFRFWLVREFSRACSPYFTEAWSNMKYHCGLNVNPLIRFDVKSSSFGLKNATQGA